MLSIPPHAHDIHQPVEHGIGCCKDEVKKQLDARKDSIKNMSHAEMQEIVRIGAAKFTAKSWEKNVLRWIHCLRILSTPTDTSITVTKMKTGKDGEPVEVTCDVQGTNGSYCHAAFS